jgi:N-acetylmuramoyl-L-alanine amidase
MNRGRKIRPGGCGVLAANALLIFVVVIRVASAAPAKRTKSAALSSLAGAGRVLDEISQKSQNVVPNAVLNSTKCIVVIPSITRKATSVRAFGVTTCRDPADGWSTPAFVTFNGRGVRTRSTALLVFILSDQGVRTLQSGELPIGGQEQAKAPLVKTSPIVPQVELNAPLFTYEGRAGVLSSSDADGVIRTNEDRSDRNSNQVLKTNSDKYVESVVSFFNTIIATGIVFHHTALIPGENTPPRSVGDVDKYHQERGFEILCFGRVYHVAYHYLIMPNGLVKSGRPERCQGAHAVGYNSYLGISLVGDFSSEDNPTGKKGPTSPSAAQIASLIRLCRRLKKHYNIPLQRFVRHSDISNTKCPGDRFPFKLILERLQRGPTG